MSDGPFSAVFAAADRGVPTAEHLVGRELADWTNSSPSQCKASDACESAQWLDKIARMPRVYRKSLALGTKCHDEAELYLLDGTPPGPIIASGVHRLPAPPLAPAFVELLFAIVDPDLPVPVVGKIDLLEPAGIGPRPGFESYHRITDHKTTSSFRYALEPEQLAHDYQALIYTAAAAPAFYGVDTSLGEVYEKVRVLEDGSEEIERYPMFRLDLSDEALGAGLAFRHVYYRTDRRLNPDSRESEVSLSAEDIRRGWLEKVRPSVLRQAAIAAVRDVREVSYDLSHCSDYGGCNFKTLCAGLGRKTLGAASFFFASTTPEGDPSVSLLKNLAAQKAAQNGDAAPAPAPSSNPLLAAMGAQKAAQTSLPLEARAETAGDPPIDPAGEPVRDPDAAPTVNPPDGVEADAHYVEPVVVKKGGDPVVPQLDGLDAFAGQTFKSLQKGHYLGDEDDPGLYVILRQRIDGDDASRLAFAPDSTSGCQNHPAKLKAFKRTTLRDASIRMCEILTSPASDEEAPQSAPEAEEAPPADEQPEEPTNLEERPLDEAERAALEEKETEAEAPCEERLEDPSEVPALEARSILFIDCAPRRPADAVFLAEILRPLQIEAAKELSVVSYRVPQYKRGEDNVVARLEQGIESGDIPLPAVLVAETSLPCTKIALEALLPHYDLVVDRVGW